MGIRFLDWMIARGWSDDTICNVMWLIPMAVGVCVGLAIGLMW